MNSRGAAGTLSGKVAVTDVAGGSADVIKTIHKSSKSVSLEDIAVPTVDSDVAVGKGSNYRLGSEGMGICGTMELAVAVVGIGGEGFFRSVEQLHVLVN